MSSVRTHGGRPSRHARPTASLLQPSQCFTPRFRVAAHRGHELEAPPPLLMLGDDLLDFGSRAASAPDGAKVDADQHESRAC
jgi:hypothetical protein